MKSDSWFQSNVAGNNPIGLSPRVQCGWPARLVPALALALLLANGFPGRAAGRRDTTWQLAEDKQKGVLEVFRGGQKLLVYALATNQFKPYVKELYTLKGDNILRDAPPDHLHHHGLMFAIRVNGINFWEERTDPGHEVPVKWLDRTAARTGPPAASFSQLIHWVAPKDSTLADTALAALLVEQRTITVTVDEAQQELALHWRSDFAVGPGTPKVTLGGANYHGLGLRLPAEFDHVAKHQNSANLPYSAEQKGDVTPANWSAVSHALNGHDTLVALFSHPHNPGEAKFFTMLDAFAYLSATQDWEKKPQEYAAGQKFRLDYLLTLYSPPPSLEFLKARYARWVKDVDAQK
jgi:hypothetical protein